MASLVPTIDLEDLRRWVGRTQESEQILVPFPSEALAGLLDRVQAPREGEPLPLPWQWIYFLDAPARSATGVDGHPQRGGFLPPVPLPRRMWAAGRMRVSTPLIVGRHARKISTVRSIELKEGKTGPLVFVTVDHEFWQGDRLCIAEEQSIVYRDAPTAPQPLPTGERPAAPAEWSQSLVPDPVLLFRYSALTYNGHRIHYDREYATRTEFYPALVVHGPLQATLLLDLLQCQRPEAAVASFSFRGMRPVFDGAPLTLCGCPQEGGARLWTADPDGYIGMSATATFA